MFLHWHWQNEAITIILKDLQYSTSISTIDIPPVSINTTLLNNIKNSADNIIITGDLNAKHTYFNCSKVNRGIALKKAFYDADLFIAENSTPTHRDSRTISSDITDYIIFSLAIFNKIQNLFIHNDLSPETSTFFSNFQQTLKNLFLLQSRLKFITKITVALSVLLFLAS